MILCLTNCGNFGDIYVVVCDWVSLVWLFFHRHECNNVEPENKLIPDELSLYQHEIAYYKYMCRSFIITMAMTFPSTDFPRNINQKRMIVFLHLIPTDLQVWTENGNLLDETLGSSIKDTSIKYAWLPKCLKCCMIINKTQRDTIKLIAQPHIPESL